MEDNKNCFLVKRPKQNVSMRLVQTLLTAFGKYFYKRCVNSSTQQALKLQGYIYTKALKMRDPLCRIGIRSKRRWDHRWKERHIGTI